MVNGGFGQAIDRAWFGHPEPYKDESFTSWFCRVAAANGLSPEHFYRSVMPGARLYLIDLDRFSGEHLFQVMSEGC